MIYYLQVGDKISVKNEIYTITEFPGVGIRMIMDSNEISEMNSSVDGGFDYDTKYAFSKRGTPPKKYKYWSITQAIRDFEDDSDSEGGDGDGGE